jgi:ribosomal protein S6
MIYETSFLFLSTLPGDELAAQVGNLKEIITSKGGKVLSEEYPQMINLAYPIRFRMDNKYTIHETAYFGWVKYELDAEKAPEVKKAIDAIKTLIRYLTLKTVTENTLVGNVFDQLEADTAKVEVVESDDQSSEEGEIDTEKVDEKLDEMLDDESDSDEVSIDENKDSE